ncbi:cytochrome b5-like heme/Steroid binding domain-containing protein [Ditylenchus destructor]|nr:cytochrome b5-like heme/Steroid binding domain-containing protein [Ditylenchus destructor]
MAETDLVVYTVEEVAKHNDEQSTWIILDNKVYDVTKFLMEHPGGEEVILQQAGQDATESFNDVGHSQDARDMTKEYLVGKIVTNDTVNAQPPVESSDNANRNTLKDILLSPTWTNFLIPVGISIGVYLLYKAMYLAQRTFSRH